MIIELLLWFIAIELLVLIRIVHKQYKLSNTVTETTMEYINAQR